MRIGQCGVGVLEDNSARQFLNWGNSIRGGIRKLELELLLDVPDDIRDRILRSIYWISHSAIHEADDHKLVDLCTALEILLIPEGRSEQSKGTVIALRYKLLGGSLDASSMKWFYDRRNDVIHGGPLPVIEPRGIWGLRLVCSETIGHIVRTSSKQPNLLNLRDLIATSYTKENLLSFIKYALMGVCEDPILTKVIKHAKSKLGQLERSGK